MPDYPVIMGVYSRSEETTLGTGATRSRHVRTTYWFVRQIGARTYDVQPVNVHHVPSGLREFIDEDALLGRFLPEPAYYQRHTVPALKSLAEKVALGGERLAQGDLDAAEREFLKALMIDDLDIGANYGLGAVYSEKREAEKLARVLNTLMGLDDAFRHEHAVTLNAFGVRLRKNGQLEQAAAFLEKALSVNPHDDHVMFNLARVYFDRKEHPKCMGMLRRALAVNPGLVEAEKFLAYCRKAAEAAPAPGVQ